MIKQLNLLGDLLERHRVEPETWIHRDTPAAYIRGLIALQAKDETRFWREVNSNIFWGGVGSVANQALNQNPGIPDEVWKAEIREFRELMIEIGQQSIRRGNENPDISSWVLAFSNWNRSDV